MPSFCRVFTCSPYDYNLCIQLSWCHIDHTITSGLHSSHLQLLLLMMLLITHSPNHNIITIVGKHYIWYRTPIISVSTQQKDRQCRNEQSRLCGRQLVRWCTATLYRYCHYSLTGADGLLQRQAGLGWLDAVDLRRGLAGRCARRPFARRNNNRRRRSRCANRIVFTFNSSSTSQQSSVITPRDVSKLMSW